MKINNNYIVGNVVSIDGTKIDILMNENSNLESFHYDGDIYDGISVGSYVGIIRGFNKIIARVEKEFLKDKEKEPLKHEFSRDRFERRLEASLVGNIYKENFEFGTKRFPMIFNEVVLLTEDEIKRILQKSLEKSTNKILIGNNVSNNIPIELAWDRIFNTHIGIFGNTGSGKSNTLTKLYTELFNLENDKIMSGFNGSKFIIIDFNGEYINEMVLHEHKKCIKLSTTNGGGDKVYLQLKNFWDIDTLSILYSATEKTQRPFLKKAVDCFLNKKIFDITYEKIIEEMSTAFFNIFFQNKDGEMLKLLNKSLEIINFDFDKENHCNEEAYCELLCLLGSSWNSLTKTYYYSYNNNGPIYFNAQNIEEETRRDFISSKQKIFKKFLEDKFNENKNNDSEKQDSESELKVTDKLKIAVNLYMIHCLSYGKASFEHINPLIQRIEAKSDFIENLIILGKNKEQLELLTVISFRDCNSDAKKMIPLLVAKQLYEEHKEKISGETEITSTVHLIIDEAHNILSYQSTRESEVWKDYRLEVFEEIIKEGRKFGFFITLATQRPCDISSTILSQLHNYFIHRLVNDQDLKMISNSVNSLDFVSKSQIPNLSPGQCIITGTSFDIPLLIQVTKLIKYKSPFSENADLVKLWVKKNEKN